MLPASALLPVAKGSEMRASRRGEALSSVSIAYTAVVSMLVNSIALPGTSAGPVAVLPPVPPVQAPKIRRENIIEVIAHFFIFFLFIVFEYSEPVGLFACEDNYFITIRFKKGFPILGC